jgi:hypothetical protein
MIGRRYLHGFVLGAALWGGLLLAFIWVIDPYGVSPLRVQKQGFNKFKPGRVNIDRYLKPYEVWRYRPRTVFLGSSRIQQALDPADLDGTPLAPAYNASIPASTLSENAAHLEQFFALDPNLKTVFVELFFSNFIFATNEAPRKTAAEFITGALALHFSATALADAARTIIANRRGRYDGPQLSARGIWLPQAEPYALGTFAGFVDGIMQVHKGLLDLNLEPSEFAALDTVVRICRAHGATLHLIITPHHPYDDYRWLSLGYWPLLEAWYRKVAAYPEVISFAQYHAPLEEPIRERMDYWYDPIHVSRKMGSLMLRSFAGRRDQDIPANMLVRVGPANVEQALAERRSGLEAWIRRNPEFVARFEAAKLATGNDEASRRWARENPALAAKRATAAKEREQARSRADRVAESLVDLAELQSTMDERYPAATITEYRNVTQELAQAGALPVSPAQGGKARNAWGGPFHAQIFPAGAWGAGVPAAHNYVFEGVPKADCARLLGALGRRNAPKVIRINLGPSGRIHETFPIADVDGCAEGSNSIGYTVIAR